MLCPLLKNTHVFACIAVALCPQNTSTRSLCALPRLEPSRCHQTCRRFTTWAQRERNALQRRFGLSDSSVAAAGVAGLALTAVLFIALLEAVHAACPALLVPREHND